MMRPKFLGRSDYDVAFLTLMGMDRLDHDDVCDVKINKNILESQPDPTPAKA